MVSIYSICKLSLLQRFHWIPRPPKDSEDILAKDLVPLPPVDFPSLFSGHQDSPHNAWLTQPLPQFHCSQHLGILAINSVPHSGEGGAGEGLTDDVALSVYLADFEQLKQFIFLNIPYLHIWLYRRESILAVNCLPQTQNNVVKYYKLQFTCKYYILQFTCKIWNF